jgi:hypothetical protein
MELICICNKTTPNSKKNENSQTKHLENMCPSLGVYVSFLVWCFELVLDLEEVHVQVHARVSQVTSSLIFANSRGRTPLNLMAESIYFRTL